ncbi:MAG: hypothetical protein WDZ80_03775 [Candidatus Paceibacterota bacterium]
MKYPNKKIIVLILIVSIILNGFVLFPKPTHALDVRDAARVIGAGAAIVGVCIAWSKIQDSILSKSEKAARLALEGVTGIDSGTIDTVLGGGAASGSSVPTEDVKAKQEQSKTTCLTILRDSLISNLKKRLLDTITDETIKWIQGEGSPRFVKNPLGLIKDAGNAAIGDTIQDIGAGDLCYPSARSRLIMQIETPVFSERVSCTLTGVLGNLNTSINDFRNDFRSGGWLAWQETMKLQNNRWGVEALTQNELQKKTNERTAIAEYEASVGGGFLSQKRCAEWTKVEGEEQGVFLSGVDYYFKAPGNTGMDEGVEYNGLTDQPAGSEWRCTDVETITPGSTIGRLTSDALGAEFDYIINASDVGTFTAAIIDAAINRLARESSEGLAGMFTNNPRSGNGATCADIPSELSDLRQKCEELQGDVGGNDITKDDIDPPHGGDDGNDGDNDREENDALNKFIEMEDGHEININESHTHTAILKTNDLGIDWVISWTLRKPDGTFGQSDWEYLDGDVENEVKYTFTPDTTGKYSLTLNVNSVWQASGETSDLGNGGKTITETVRGNDGNDGGGDNDGDNDNDDESIIGRQVIMTANTAYESWASWPIGNQTSILIDPGSKGTVVGGPEPAPVQGSTAEFWQVNWDDYQTTWIEDSVIEVSN